MPAGAANVPLSSVPAGVLGQFAFAPVPNSPGPELGGRRGARPEQPDPELPDAEQPRPELAVPNSPVANSGFDGILPSDLLDSILLSSIPVDWSSIFAGTGTNANVPMTGLTLATVYATPVALAALQQR